MDEFYIKQNDRRESIERVLKGSNLLPVDLSGATVKFSMRETKSQAMKVSAGTVQVVSAVGGQVRYSWAAGDTDTVGTFDAEWEATFADGTKQKFPNDTQLVVYVTDAISS